MDSQVFISYAHDDAAIAKQICAELEGRRLRCWIAPRDVPPGTEWAEAVVTAIGASRAFLLVFTALANDSPQVLREVERAVHRRRLLIPFRVELVPFTKSLEYYLSACHWIDAGPPLDSHIHHLGGTVAALLSRQGPLLDRLDRTLEVALRRSSRADLWRTVEPLIAELEPIVDDYFRLFRAARRALSAPEPDLAAATAEIRDRRAELLTARIRVREWARALREEGHDRRLNTFADSIVRFFYSSEFMVGGKSKSAGGVLVDLLEYAAEGKADRDALDQYIRETLQLLEERWVAIAQTYARLKVHCQSPDDTP